MIFKYSLLNKILLKLILSVSLSFFKMYTWLALYFFWTSTVLDC